VLYTPHGYAFAGYFSHSSERLAYKAIERALAPLTSLVTCVCDSEARLARSLGAGRRVRVVHNGITPPPPGEAAAALVQLRRRGPLIGALTQLRPGKGLETLLDAAPQLLERHPDAQLAIVGDGPNLGPLSGRAAALGVSGAVHFLGPSSDPLAALRGMDIFVHPSWA
jgi:glycosyltransferase involved in cell wall biosynthesis